MRDRQLLMDALDQARKHVRHGEEHLANQRKILEELTRHGHAVEKAKSLLTTLEHSQRLHIADRDRIADELRKAVENDRFGFHL